ncbi:MAG: TlpA family protein disulfide reductase [Prevotellaceae bacterium]|jgi:peroxiredoxin|nr:TlpA family protein disulfide reductase [Prevotellaceae bacterium]
MKHLLIFICLIGLTGFFACTNSSDTRGYIVKTGDKAPDFTIRYLDGTTAQLSDLRGKVVMLQFTASWCGVCRKEMPHIEKDIWQQYKDRPDFALIGIDYKESADTTRQFASAIPVTYPLTLDKNGETFHLYAAKDAGVTRNVIIDRYGTIVFLTRLYDEQEFAEMLTVIAQLMGND